MYLAICGKFGVDMYEVILDVEFCEKLKDKDYLYGWLKNGKPSHAYNRLFFTLNGKKVYFDDDQVDAMFYSLTKEEKY